MSMLECSHHLAIPYNIPNTNLVISKENKSCMVCGLCGPHLYYCLFKGCHTTGCLDKSKNHVSSHLQVQPTHCLFLNLTTRQIFCIKCQSEVDMEMINRPRCISDGESDLEPEDVCPIDQKDSGHGSFSTLPRNTPERNHIVRNNGFGPPMMISGDTTDSSDDEHEITTNRKMVGLVGLQNIGNTCYMNAALQALSNTYPLRHFFLECPATVQILSEDRKPGLSRQYQLLIRDIWMKKNGGYVTPSGILYGIRSVHAMFRGYQQHDTQEFLRNFMDQLHEELKQVSPPECTIHDVENLCMSVDEPALSSSYDSSEGEYETCDSGVSERSSLSDDTDGAPTKHKLNRSCSPGRRLRARMLSGSVIDAQPSASNQSLTQNKKAVKHRSIISDIFDGKLLSSVQCLTCDRVSSKVETFQDLSLPIPSRDHLVVLHGRNAAPGATCSDAVMPAQDGWIWWFVGWLKSWFYGPTVTLHDCLAAFFSTDELKGDNMYSCERCNKLRNGLKYSKVLQLPEVLCIHLKRFRHELMFSSKISAVVSFPLKGLDMRPYLHKDCVSQVNNYELFSVICHHGTAGGGHYTCYALNSGGWYEFDDQCVTRVHPDTVANCEAYVLFYRKVLSDSNVTRAKVSELALLAKDAPEIAYVSKQWLSRFSTCAEPGPIDNSDFLCAHNCLHPKRAMALDKLAIPIAKNVYDYLFKKYGGSPAVSNVHVCATCQALYSRIAAESERLAQLNNEYEYQNEPPTHLLSNTWYTQWKSFVEGKISEPPPPIDNTRTSIPQGGTEDYIEINKDIWDFFFSLYSGGPELLIPRAEGHMMVVSSPSPNCEEERPELCLVDDLGRGEPMDTEESNDSRDTDSREDLVPLSQATTNHSTNSSCSMLNVVTPDEDDRGKGQMQVEVPCSTSVMTATKNSALANANSNGANNKRNVSVRQRRKKELIM
ncbi:ubiquitin carboxyl-terminal hydrolase 20 [Atheta coriaria]|uniref:ubiquitin carboxyl-terminal hydrolase 20 n=1 Tax=Dalotia coriaria TaxID=877792 RepID=UPI0031F3D456